MKAILLLIGPIMLFSCRSHKQHQYEINIVGDWKNIDKELAYHNKKIGYSFLENQTCEFKTGFFKPGGYQVRTKGQTFLGTTTKYKIEGDTLRIYSPEDSTWESAQILDIDPTFLRLQTRQGNTKTFERINPVTKKWLSFDQIIVSSSGNEGTCSISSTLINENGSALFYGERYNLVNGLFEFSITADRYKKIAEGFQKANVGELEASYHAGWSDDETIVTTFIDKGKIVKSIYDYARAAPGQLNSAYTPVRYLYQREKLTNLGGKQKDLVFKCLRFEFNNKILRLEPTESLYLLALLRHAEKTKVKFNSNYTVKFINQDSLARIESDGQYYKLIWKSGRRITLDLGFNFIKRNLMLLRAKARTEADDYNLPRIY
jgi:hypothetical protein